MAFLNATRAVTLGLAMALMPPIAAVQTLMPAADGDRAPHLYPTMLPGTLGCVDDAYSRVTWGCD